MHPKNLFSRQHFAGRILSQKVAYISKKQFSKKLAEFSTYFAGISYFFCKVPPNKQIFLWVYKIENMNLKMKKI